MAGWPALSLVCSILLANVSHLHPPASVVSCRLQPQELADLRVTIKLGRLPPHGYPRFPPRATGRGRGLGLAIGKG